MGCLPETPSFLRSIDPLPSFTASAFITGALKATISLVHTHGAVIVALAIDGLDHFACGSLVNLHPAVHFTHVYLAQHFFLQVALVQDELQETGFVKTILGAQVHKSAGVTIIAAVETCTFLPAAALFSMAVSLPSAPVITGVQVIGILIVFQKMIELQCCHPL